MPQVIASAYLVDEPQIDGRRWVMETLTLDVGDLLVSNYLADAGADHKAHLDALVAATNEQLSEAAGG